MKRKRARVIASPNSDIAIECSNISKVFYKGNGEKFNALTSVSLSIKKGSLTVIAGRNGSGKSTLMYIMAGLLKPTSGNIVQNGTIGVIMQDSESAILGDTPFDDVAFSLKKFRLSKEERLSKITEYLGVVGLADKMYFPSHSLSGGEKRRLQIASILALEKNILIFDEPYSNLDYDGVRDVNKIIQELYKNNITIIIVTHEIEKCLAHSREFVVLHEGRVVFDGSPKEAISLNLGGCGIRNPIEHGDAFESLWW